MDCRIHCPSLGPILRIDGGVSANEVKSSEPVMRGPMTFEVFDRDGSGRITEQELDTVRG
jgi:hypothetical protein